MKIEFETARLQVFKEEVDLGPCYNPNRTFYVAFSFDGLLVGKPMQVASALVLHFSELSHWVDWIETSEEARRKGIACELVIGIRQDLEGYVMVDGVTDAGMALRDSLEKTRH